MNFCHYFLNKYIEEWPWVVVQNEEQVLKIEIDSVSQKKVSSTVGASTPHASVKLFDSVQILETLERKCRIFLPEIQRKFSWL